MPPAFINTVRQEIFYEYAKSRSHSILAGEIDHDFVVSMFKALRDGQVTMSRTICEWQHQGELPQACAFCSSQSDLQMDHLIPKSRGGGDDAGNMVWSCRKCSKDRGNKGVYEWLGLQRKDALHHLVAGKYLMALYNLHERSRTLDIEKGDIAQLCRCCRLPGLCIEWNKVGKLTCFCLESVF